MLDAVSSDGAGYCDPTVDAHPNLGNFRGDRLYIHSWYRTRARPYNGNRSGVRPYSGNNGDVRPYSRNNSNVHPYGGNQVFVLAVGAVVGIGLIKGTI